MSDETRRPHDKDHEQEPEEQEASQQERNPTSGDGPAAGSLEEREAVARDEDEPFGDD